MQTTPMKTRQRAGQQLYLAVFLLLTMHGWTGLGQSSPVLYPRGTNVQSLWALPGAKFGTPAEQTMVATLQGLVARQSSEQIYLDGGTGYSLWKNHLHTNYGISLTSASSPWAILRHFRGQIGGYVLYDASKIPDSLNAANSLAGKMHGIAVNASIESQVRANGVTNLLYDCRAMNALNVWTNHFRGVQVPLVVEQRANIAANLRGLFYLEYAPYNGAQGAIQFSTNGLPILAARDLFWPGLEDPPTLIQHLNSYPRDPSSPDGYSLVPVLVWGETIASIANVVSNLGPQVRVVTPDVLAREVRNRVGRNLNYSFSLGLQGWRGAIAGKPYDKAQWSATRGAPGGVLLLDGSDLGNFDTAPNAWFSRQISLPQNVNDLSFDTKANNDGQLRVRVDDGRGNQVTLLNWEKLSQPNVWVHRSISVRGYGGQTVTFLLEQNDGGKGIGEFRYVDNVQVHTSDTPVYRPLSPRILSIAWQQGVQIRWRDNDVSENGFRLERRVSGGSWTEIAVVSTNVVEYQDRTVQPGTRYEYRVRSWNPGGNSEYSLPRAVQVPARPVLSVSLSGGQVALGWPASEASSILCSSSTLSYEARWTPVTTASVVTNGQWMVRLPLLTGQSFFQLK